MKQVLLSEDAATRIEDMRENPDSFKAALCEAFAEEVLNAISSTQSQRNASWRVLAMLQEYSHLIDSLTAALTAKSDVQLKRNQDEHREQIHC